MDLLRDRLSIADHLPGPAERAGRWAYNRWRERRADRAFRARRTPSAPTSDRSRDDPSDHVLCVVVDALRDDFDDGTAPFLSDRYRGSAVAAATWTYPSVASLLTGQYPHEHGAMRRTDDPDRNADGVTLPPSIDVDRPTLPELFSAAGFETFAGTGFTMPFLALEGRFETHRLFQKVEARTVIDAYLDWFEDRADGRTFAYLHLFDPHGPFDRTPPPEYRRRHDVADDVAVWRYTDRWDGDEVRAYQDRRRRVYWAAVDYVDDELRRLDRRLDAYGQSPAVIVTADHGEAFWEMAAFDADRFVDSRPAYSVGHGGTPYEAVARVPLCARGLALDPGPASTVDVVPTLLDAAGLTVPEWTTGTSLLDAPTPDRTRLIEATRFGYERKAAYRDGWKLLVSRGDDETVGFELPEEEPATLPADVRTDLLDALPAWPGGGRERTVDSQVRRRLDELGYT